MMSCSINQEMDAFPMTGHLTTNTSCFLRWIRRLSMIYGSWNLPVKKYFLSVNRKRMNLMPDFHPMGTGSHTVQMNQVNPKCMSNHLRRKMVGNGRFLLSVDTILSGAKTARS